MNIHILPEQITIYDRFYISEIMVEYTSQMSTIMPAALGGTLGACVILIISAALILIR